MQARKAEPAQQPGRLLKGDESPVWLSPTTVESALSMLNDPQASFCLLFREHNCCCLSDQMSPTCKIARQALVCGLRLDRSAEDAEFFGAL